jgi:hypothetical protein
MKLFRIVALASAMFAGPALAADEFDLTIDGETITLEAGQEKTATLKDGRSTTLKLERKKTQTFEHPAFSFQHPGQFTVASKEIERGITQHIIVSATGTMVLVQVYDSIDPSMLVALMTKEVTDEDVAGGAVKDTQPHRVTLNNAVELAGERSILKAASDEIIVDVLARAVGRGGVLVVTRHDIYTSPEDKPMLDQFWSTLAVKGQ